MALDYSSNLNSSSSSFTESHNVLDIDHHIPQHINSLNEASPNKQHQTLLNIDDEPCIDLVELEWSTLKFEPDFFLANDDEDEPKVEYLMKIVEELQKENRQLRKRVEQLSTTCQ